MAITASASFNNKLTYTVTDTRTNFSTTDADSQTITSSYTVGTGDKQINSAASITGTLAVSGSKQFDLYNNGTGVFRVLFGVTGGVPMNTIKHLSVYNMMTTKGANLEISTTGANNLNGIMGTVAFPTGSQVIRPYSSFAYNDPYDGVSVNDLTKSVTLNDIAGSGSSFKMLILGVDLNQPTGTVGINPYG